MLTPSGWTVRFSDGQSEWDDIQVEALSVEIEAIDLRFCED